MPDHVNYPSDEILAEGFQSVALKVSANEKISVYFEDMPVDIGSLITDIRFIETRQVIEDMQGNAYLARNMTFVFDSQMMNQWIEEKQISIPGNYRPIIELRYSSDIREELVEVVRQKSQLLSIPVTILADANENYAVMFEQKDKNFFNRILARSGVAGIFYLQTLNDTVRLESYSGEEFLLYEIEKNNEKQIIERVFLSILSHYNKTNSGAGLQVIRIVDVNSLSQINEIMAFLERLLSIERVVLKEQTSDYLELGLITSLDARQLYELLSFQKQRLLEVKAEISSGVNADVKEAPPVWRWVSSRIGARKK